MIRNTLILLCLLLQFGCATKYMGPSPKLDDSVKNKTTEERTEIFERYKFKEGYFNQHKNAFKMGSDEELYTLDSLRPVIDEVNPTAVNKELDKVEILSKVSLGMIGAALAMLIIDSDVAEWSSGQKSAYYGLLGLSIVGNYISFSFIENAAVQHNRGLRKKLSLGLKAKLDY